MKQALLIFISLLISGCTNKRSSKTTSTVTTDSISCGLTDSLRQKSAREDSLKLDPSANVIDTKSSSQTINWVLEPVVKEEFEGKAIPSDSLILKTEFEYYPLSTTEIKLFLQNFTETEYTSGEEYSIAYYDKKKDQWEPLPVYPMINDVLWIISKDQGKIECQTISLYTDRVKNRPGKYRIRKLFNNDTEMAEAVFEMVDKPTVDRKLMNLIYKRMLGLDPETDTIDQNVRGIHTSYGDSIYVDVRNNGAKYQDMFRRRIMNYAGLNFGPPKQLKPLEFNTSSDTLGITMKTAKTTYPVGTSKILVKLRNTNKPVVPSVSSSANEQDRRILFFGEDYGLARKLGDAWVAIPVNSIVNSVGITVEEGGDYEFKALLFPLVNEYVPGTYKVYKLVEFEGIKGQWYMSAQFTLY